jgi:hypothetical protein
MIALALLTSETTQGYSRKYKASPSTRAAPPPAPDDLTRLWHGFGGELVSFGGGAMPRLSETV